MAKKDSPGSTRGLGSAIGTFTHTEYRPEARASHSHAEMVDLLRKIRKIKRQIASRISAIRTSYPVNPGVIFCLVCGGEIHYQGETAEEWGKRRKCDVCLAGQKAVSASYKHCLRCGGKFFPESGSAKRSWNTVSLCPGCRNQPVNRETREEIPEDAELNHLKEELAYYESQ